jgi:signal transduction histidine kinase
MTETIFNRGRRGQSSCGTGLGLWIAKNYAHSMAGELSFVQTDHDGQRRTTFMLSLPKLNNKPKLVEEAHNA